MYSPAFSGLAQRGGYLLAYQRGVARACPHVLVVLGLVAVLLVLVLLGLHALHSLLLQQLDAVHERHGAHALADALQHVRDPGVALAADVDEDVRVLYLQYVLRRRLVGVRLAARREQHAHAAVVAHQLAREVVWGKRGRDHRYALRLRVLHASARGEPQRGAGNYYKSKQSFHKTLIYENCARRQRHRAPAARGASHAPSAPQPNICKS